MNVCVVIPVYNHGEPLRKTLEELQRFDLPVIVVDDGSDERTRTAVDELGSEHGCRVVRLPVNSGKGGAVMAGLRAAYEDGFTHALQVDADGQHDLEDVPRLLAASERRPEALVSGDPSFDESVPASRLYGRRITSFWVAIETLSARMPDTMCGFRVYPLAAVVPLIDEYELGTRMDFDIEIAVRLAWRAVPIVAVPSRVIYPADGTSHFRLFSDNWRISKLHARLVLGMLVRLPAMAARRLNLGGAHWSAVAERGSIVGMRLMFSAYRLLGRPVFSLMLYPVIAYFFLTDSSSRRVSRSFLEKIHRQRRGLGMTSRKRPSSFRHLLEFGHAVLDKGAMWAGRFPDDAVELADREEFERFQALNRGVMFIGSHLGNLEVLRAFGRSRQDIVVNALVFTRHSEKFNRMLRAISPAALENVIQVDSLGPESVGLLQERLDDGEHVAMVADRTSVRFRQRSVYADFLGEPAPFPEGPFILAHLLGCPVYLLFCLKLDGRYRIILEPFASPLKLPRASRQAALREAAQRYAERLEHYCLLAPHQWFNFFDFWRQAEDASV